MNSIKIIFSDIDGTLLDKNREISTQTIQAYQKIRDFAKLILITSRMPKGMVYFQDELDIKDSPLVCYNGGLILKNSHGNYLSSDNILLDVPIPGEIVRDIGEYLRAKEVNFSVYSYNDWYTTKDDFWTKREENNTRTTARKVEDDYFYSKNIAAHKIMIMGEKEEIDDIYAFIEKHFISLELYRSKDTYIEISSKNTSKGIAVEKLLNDIYTETSIKDTIAFGDNYNDIPLFKSVGTSVAVSNGKKALKDIANFVCLSNKEHGVADFLNHSFHLL